MKILILVRSVVDDSTPVALGDEYSQRGCRWVINPFDEVAMEGAVQLKKQWAHPCELIAVGYNDEPGRTVLERALAIGADQAIALAAITPALSDAPLVHATTLQPLLQALTQQLQPDLVLMGAMAFGQEQGEVAPMLAGALGWPCAVAVSQLAVAPSTPGLLSIEQRRPTLNYQARISLPAVLSCALDWVSPRYITLPALVMAKQKPKAIWSGPAAVTAPTCRWQSGMSSKPSKQPLQSVEELVDVLQAGGWL
ncbi:hypothetical protein [Celerinatantimonas sp. YJH-8]|uniref:hypothetical protein n=1 Tax=Celerinatantimonas sp. YJH-8 TaxID=3228714 RepID=UPI0038C9952F